LTAQSLAREIASEVARLDENGMTEAKDLGWTPLDRNGP
jgi:hypothetical protein